MLLPVHLRLLHLNFPKLIGLPNETLGLLCEGQKVPINAVLTSDTCELSRGTGSLSRPPPPERFALSLTHAQTHHIVFVRGGQFLFEVLANIGAYFVTFWVD